MSDGYGTPIRLLFDDPKAMRSAGYEGGMELNALSIALSVERKVGGMSMPFTGGKRFGIDLNRSNSTIIIEGIFVDDDLSRRTPTAANAIAQIDFGIENKNAQAVGSGEVITSSDYEKLASGSYSLTLYSKSGAGYNIYFYASSGSVGHISGGDIRVKDTATSTFIKRPQLATAVAAAIATFGEFNTSLTTSEIVPSAGNTLLTITQATSGPMSRSSSVSFSNSSDFFPYHTQFTGGSDASSIVKSAGDKVQDLYGILHNTQRKGSAIIGGAALAIGAVAATVATGGTAAAIGGAAAAGGTAGLVVGIAEAFKVEGDYPIGIQIPYNSMIQAPDGKKYTARNFLIRTGFQTVDSKMSQGNDNSTSVEFSTDDNATGIQGAIQKFDVSYSAGEQLYTYQMVFAPIDALA
jgi:hypothetical protein